MQATSHENLPLEDGEVAQKTVNFELKSLSDGQFEGYGSVFGNVDLGGDVVIQGAFKKTLSDYKKSGKMPLMFWMHDPSQVPGKWLQMHEDNHGLYVKGQFADTQLGKDAHTLMKMDAVRGLSIGYTPYKDGVAYGSDGERLLKSVHLWETSIASIPMNQAANATSVKNLIQNDSIVEVKRACEKMLRDKGFSQRAAKVRVAEFFDEALTETVEKNEGLVDKTAIKAPAVTETVAKIMSPELMELNEGLSRMNQAKLERELEKRLSQNRRLVK